MTTADPAAEVTAVHRDAVAHLRRAIDALNAYREHTQSADLMRAGRDDLLLLDELDSLADDDQLDRTADEAMARFIATGTYLPVDDKGHLSQWLHDETSDRVDDLHLWSGERQRENAASDAYWKARNNFDHPQHAQAKELGYAEWLTTWPFDEDEDDPEPVNPCDQCREAEAEEHGMCGSCLHNAYRSGWQPGDE